MRLYGFECGTMKCDTSGIKMNQGFGVPYEIPIPWFVVTHPRGNVLIDGGNAPEVATNAAEHWGMVADFFVPTMTPEQACIPSLERAGIDPASITHILQTHLHLDHTGALASLDRLPGVQSVLARRPEYEFAHAPEYFALGAYVRKDFMKDGIPWALLDDDEDGWDFFGDGTIRCWFTPGHSPGHMSVEVTLPETGSVLLTVDAAYTVDHWNELAFPSALTSVVDVARSVRKLKRIAARSDSMLVFGHCPDTWPAFEQAPGYYA